MEQMPYRNITALVFNVVLHYASMYLLKSIHLYKRDILIWPKNDNLIFQNITNLCMKQNAFFILRFTHTKMEPM